MSFSTSQRTLSGSACLHAVQPALRPGLARPPAPPAEMGKVPIVAASCLALQAALPRGLGFRFRVDLYHFEVYMKYPIAFFF